MPMNQVPQELTNLEQENWIAAQVLVDKEMQEKEIGIKGSFVEPQGNCRSTQDVATIFQMPDFQSIAKTVTEWQEKDRHAQAAKNFLLHGKALKDIDLQIWLATLGQQLEIDEDGLLFQNCPDLKRKVLYEPECAREVIVQEAHVIPLGSHLSPAKTLDRVKHSFFWLTQSKDVHKYCTGCAVCAARKGQGQCNRPYLKNIPSPSTPMELVSIDVLSLKTTTKGNRKALVAVDLLTKFLFIAPCKMRKWIH